MAFFRSKFFWITVLIQLSGLFFIGLGNWANWIQYISGFGMAYALWEYSNVHREEIRLLREQLTHLHQKHDDLHDAIRGKEGT